MTGALALLSSVVALAAGPPSFEGSIARIDAATRERMLGVMRRLYRSRRRPAPALA